MRFHKEGYISLIIITILTLTIMIANNYLLSSYPKVQFVLYLFSILLWIAVVQFFKSPRINKKENKNAILSPAEGKIVVIEKVLENEYFKDKRLQVSIFMSPINVHVNRYPISGIVNYFKYHAGEYFVAYHPKSSLENERTTTVIKDDNGIEILFRQVAGAMARRIVYYHSKGKAVKQQEQCGFIKFGSRVDIFLPLDVNIKVKLNEKVKCGESILAEF